MILDGGPHSEHARQRQRARIADMSRRVGARHSELLREVKADSIHGAVSDVLHSLRVCLRRPSPSPSHDCQGP